MHLDETQCRGAVKSRDARFDGFFYTAVLSTGIYCRPSCPARTPKDENMVFHPSAASAQAAGFRACKRCRPDATPGSPEWNIRSDTVARAMRLIADGVVDRQGVPSLASTLGYSVRQIERLLGDELGAGPQALAQAQRAQSARTLIEATDLPMSDIAFAAGFSSVRAFNDVVRATYASSPTDLRAAATGAAGPTLPHSGVISLRLPFRQPLEPSNLLGHLIATGVPGVEEFRDGAYRASVQLPRGWGIVSVRRPVGSAFPVTLRLTDVRDLAAAVSRVRRLLDLDADPVAVGEALGRDDHLRSLVDEAPGRRVPRILDPAAFALRAVLGQQVSTAAARTHAARLVAALGEPIVDPDGGLTHLFPTAEAVVASAHEASSEPGAAPGATRLDEILRMPASRRRTLLGMATALAEGEVRLDPGADWQTARASMLALPGIGPWTVETIAMRALGDPDAFVGSDLGVLKAAEALGLASSRPALERAAIAWSPWRAYAVQYLWATSPHAVNSIPEGDVVLPAVDPSAVVPPAVIQAASSALEGAAS